MNFVDINIDREKIHSTIDKYACIKNLEETENKKEYYLESEGKNCKICVHYKQKGLTTLYVQGKDIDFGKSICQKIYDNLKYFDVSEFNGSIIVNESDFANFIKKLENLFPSELSNSQISGGTLYKLTKSKEGSISLSYYTRSKKLLIQGKAGKYLKIINQELIVLGYSLINIISGMRDIVLPESNDILKEYLPSIESKLPKKVRNIAASSLQSLKINGNFSDYGLILIPMFRTLEHVMRKILEDGNYEFEDKNNSFKMFSECSGVYKLASNKDSNLDSSCINNLELGYTYFNKNRHCTTHMDVDEIDIVSIESKEMAEGILAECIKCIEDLSCDY